MEVKVRDRGRITLLPEYQLADDPDYGERACEILSRIGKGE